MGPTAYAIVLMMCPINQPCQMVAIKPQSYTDRTVCEQEAVAALKNWQRNPPAGAALKAICKRKVELCNLVTIHNRPQYFLPIASKPDDRYGSAAITERLFRALHILCNAPPPSGCGDEEKSKSGPP